MLKLVLLILIIIANLSLPVLSKAESSSFITIVNPIRGADFWDIKEKPIDAVLGEKEILQKYGLSATWLIRYDALEEEDIVNVIKSDNSYETGLLLEVTPSWTKASSVAYRQSLIWHNAGSVFLTGYSLEERKKLIDQAFQKFEDVFGYDPKSVGAWWIDSYSLRYMQEKYHVTAALIVADQYSTDNYQIWGQYFATPYYPAKNNLLMPAQSWENKIPVVIMQWASRDPLNGYGKGVEESTYSVQANDYIDYHNLTTDYFSKLIDAYSKQSLNQFSQVVVGLENSYSWKKYQKEYEAQMKVLVDKKQKGEVRFAAMDKFADWYQKHFPGLSPEQIIVADDPLGSHYKVVWFMNNYYRVGWFYNQEGSVFRDVRQYLEGQNELCFDTACQEVNFAKFSTRVLDDVTYSQKLVVDQGKIIDFKVEQKNNEYLLSYKNEAGRTRLIRFLPRDIAVDNKISSIDGFILDAVKVRPTAPAEFALQTEEKVEIFQQSFIEFGFKTIKFILFLIAALFIPGFLLARGFNQKSIALNIFLGIGSGMVFYTLVAFLSGLLKINWLVYLYLITSLLTFLKLGFFRELYGQIKGLAISKTAVIAGLLIIAGAIFQTLAMARSGWVYDFGIGFFGPTGHDGIWHQALVNQLVKELPPQNPGFSGVVLSNYHYFYDLLIASSQTVSYIPAIDLIYRFYPILFSLMLGFGTWVLTGKVLPIFFVYFAGSFGWIVEFLKNRQLSGESDFWVNQPISMNINPPFAVSLILIIFIVLLMRLYQEKKTWVGAIILAVAVGSLVEFKVYAGIIALGALLFCALYKLILKKDKSLMLIFLGALMVSFLIFYPQNKESTNLLVLAPFWFIHSMIDFPDRVGWVKLSSARDTYYQKGFWLKYLLIEVFGFLLFLAGNLGTRFLGLIALLAYFFHKKILPQTLQKELQFIFWLMLISLIIPTVFIQKGNPWNTIQFFYYFLYFASVLAGLGLGWLYRRGCPYLIWPIITLILILTPINSWVSFQEGLSQYPPARLTLGELEALNYLKNLPVGVVLTYPYDKTLKDKLKAPYPLISYETSVYVSAFSDKTTYLEDEIQQDILQTGYQKRRVESLDFFRGRDIKWLNQFLQENKIRYIYLPKFLNISLSYGWLKQVFDNSEVKIYEVIN